MRYCMLTVSPVFIQRRPMCLSFQRNLRHVVAVKPFLKSAVLNVMSYSQEVAARYAKRQDPNQ
eukprot:5484365-Amphidinium_carterae.1